MLVSSIGADDLKPCRCDLASEVLRRFGQLRLQVTGASMLPSIWPGDLVDIHRSSLNQISRGDVVLFLRGCRFIVHRVIEISRDGLITRGDSVLGPDSPVSSDELLGLVVSITGTGGRRVPSRLGAIGGLIAFAARHSTVFVHLLLRLHARYRQPMRPLSPAPAFRPEAAWPN
jgi:Peptidase S24-like